MRKLLLLLLVLSPGIALQAQSTEDEIKARLLHKPLYLRGLWLDDRLDFDVTGNVLGQPTVGPFTLAAIEIDKVELKKDHLKLEGQRFGLEFNEIGYERVALSSRRKKKFTPVKFELLIAAPATGDYRAPLDTVLASEIAELLPAMPEFWQQYATTHLTPIRYTTPHPLVPLTATPKIDKVGGSVSAPVVIQMPNPQFNKYARALEYGGTCLIYLQVDQQGKPRKIRVLRPVGMGLDEEALAAAEQYAFSPALRNSKPVAVEINVEVKFQVITK